ncbi:Hypothetical protein, putative [Bodo saltans]|uniref:C2H2-type domain-containing protein n=1 Tax=Bodo saltans TaxID=75058 RepID=A0A0S4KJY6_BODSA|nr:Hypothetical protein, putative [Bodo saltans]|eukprot:CUI15309.1 Hypothetical protein, putative [Bodo saltans]
MSHGDHHDREELYYHHDSRNAEEDDDDLLVTSANYTSFTAQHSSSRSRIPNIGSSVSSNRWQMNAEVGLSGDMVRYLSEMTTRCFLETSFLRVGLSKSHPSTSRADPYARSSSSVATCTSPKAAGNTAETAPQTLSEIIGVSDLATQVGNLLFTTRAVIPSMRAEWASFRSTHLQLSHVGPLVSLVAVALQYVVRWKFRLVLSKEILALWFRAACAGITRPEDLISNSVGEAKSHFNGGEKNLKFSRVDALPDWADAKCIFVQHVATHLDAEGGNNKHLVYLHRRKQPSLESSPLLGGVLHHHRPSRNIELCLSLWLNSSEIQSNFQELSEWTQSHPVRKFLCSCSAFSNLLSSTTVDARSHWSALHRKSLEILLNLEASTTQGRRWEGDVSVDDVGMTRGLMEQWFSLRHETVAMFCLCSALQSLHHDDGHPSRHDTLAERSATEKDNPPANEEFFFSTSLDDDGQQHKSMMLTHKDDDVVLRLGSIIHVGYQGDASRLRHQFGVLLVLLASSSQSSRVVASSSSDRLQPQKRSRGLEIIDDNMRHVGPTISSRTATQSKQLPKAFKRPKELCSICGKMFDQSRMVIHSRMHRRQSPIDLSLAAAPLDSTTNVSATPIISSVTQRREPPAVVVVEFVEAESTPALLSESPSATLDVVTPVLPHGIFSRDECEAYVRRFRVAHPDLFRTTTLDEGSSLTRNSSPNSVQFDDVGVSLSLDSGFTLHSLPDEHDDATLLCLNEYLR